MLGFSPGSGSWLRAELAWAGTQVTVCQVRASYCASRAHKTWVLPTIGTVLPGGLWGPWLLA